MMKTFIIIVAAAGLASEVHAENRATIVQFGIGNMQTMIQQGSNTAVVVQGGAGNSSDIQQSGEKNVAAVAQVGTGLSRTVVQDGDRLGYGSIQATSNLTGSFTATGGNAYTSVTADLDVE
jgi:hypothetical protein